MTSFRRAWFRPKNGTFLQILDMFPRETKKPREEWGKYAKKEVVWGGTWVIFPPKISIFVSFRSEKGCNSTTRKPPIEGCAGWPMNCCPATQKVAFLYIILTQNPSNWGSKIGSKIRQFSRFLGTQLGTWDRLPTPGSRNIPGAGGLQTGLFPLIFPRPSQGVTYRFFD